jgi:cytochrome c oxidase assembly factor CtaG
LKAKARTYLFGDIVINSNWIDTILMALAFAVSLLILGQNIRDFMFGRMDHPVSFFYFLVDAIYGFVFAYWFRGKYVAVAFLLLGTQYTIRLALAYFHVAATLQHSAALVGSVAKQVSLIIILVAIADWFRNVVRRDSQSDSGGANT